MQWPHYLAAFWSGAFFINTLPHFVTGVCGDRFPTPFSHPPGRGLSSPLVNLTWSLFNLLIAILLFRSGRVAAGDSVSIGLWLAGFVLLAYYCPGISLQK